MGEQPHLLERGAQTDGRFLRQRNAREGSNQRILEQAFRTSTLKAQIDLDGVAAADYQVGIDELGAVKTGD